jgi:Ni/Fe-hydrogenase subunit HybB-like protein
VNAAPESAAMWLSRTMEYTGQDLHWNHEMAPMFVACALAACRCSSAFYSLQRAPLAAKGP